MSSLSQNSAMNKLVYQHNVEGFRVILSYIQQVPENLQVDICLFWKYLTCCQFHSSTNQLELFIPSIHFI